MLREQYGGMKALAASDIAPLPAAHISLSLLKFMKINNEPKQLIILNNCVVWLIDCDKINVQ